MKEVLRGKAERRHHCRGAGKLDADAEQGRGHANGRRHLATSKISVRGHAWPADNAYNNVMMTDEYTALQKYISTYRDPKAAAAETQDDDGPAKKKPWWQVSHR